MPCAAVEWTAIEAAATDTFIVLHYIVIMLEYTSTYNIIPGTGLVVFTFRVFGRRHKYIIYI